MGLFDFFKKQSGKKMQTDAEITLPLKNTLINSDTHVQSSPTQMQELEALMKALADYDDNVHKGAAEAIEKLGNALMKALYDDDSNVRKGAAEAIGKLGNALMKAVGHHLGRVKKSAAEALRQLGDPRTVVPLVKVLGMEVPSCYGNFYETRDSGKCANCSINPMCMNQHHSAHADLWASIQSQQEQYERRVRESFKEVSTRFTADRISLDIPLHLQALRLKFLELPEKYSRLTTLTGARATEGHKVIRVICDVCNDVTRALNEGIGVEGLPINKQQISSGLKRLIADARTDLGIVALILNADGVQLYQKYLSQLEEISNKLR